MRASGLGTVGRYCLTFMAMLLLACGAFAQSTTDGAIGGTVTDQSGAVVPNAAVSAKNLSTGANASGASDEGGRFLLIHLQPGVYSLEVSTSGFSAFKATRIIVEVGRTTTVDTTLGVQAQTETITATAEAPVITTDRADFSTNINDVALDNLPINGRNWMDLAMLAPGSRQNQSSGVPLLRWPARKSGDTYGFGQSRILSSGCSPARSSRPAARSSRGRLRRPPCEPPCCCSFPPLSQPLLLSPPPRPRVPMTNSKRGRIGLRTSNARWRG